MQPLPREIKPNFFFSTEKKTPSKQGGYYYPFGMTINERSWNADSYDHGFNGMEKDDEVKGSGKSLDFGARIYDPRLGKWMSTDPMQSKYPSQSPYNYSINSPISLYDPNGKWVEVTKTKYFMNKSGQLQPKKWYNIFKKTVQVDVNIVIHNAKVYNYDAYDKKASDYQQKMEEAAQRIVSDIKAQWGGIREKTKYVRENGKRVRDEEGSFIRETRKTYIVTVEFSEPIEVIEDLNNVNADGPKSDQLFILASSKGANDLYRLSDPTDLQGVQGFVSTIGGNLAVLDIEDIRVDWDGTPGMKRPNVIGHEFGHQMGLLHIDGGIMRNKKEATASNVNRIGSPLRPKNRGYSYEPAFIEAKSAGQSETSNTNSKSEK